MINKFKIIILTISCFINTFSISFDKTPVIFIDANDSEYLGETLAQSKTNDNRVILIGDENNKHYAQFGIEHFSLSDYSKSSNYFRTVYKHLANSDYEEELLSFTRWFILEEFMRVNQIKRAFYAETDVMIYCDISSEDKLHFINHDAALLIQHGFCDGSISFWNYKALSSFCSFLKSFYEDKKMMKAIKDRFAFGGDEYHDDWPHMANWMHENGKIFKIASLNNLIENSTFDTSVRDDYILVPNAASILEYKRYEMKEIKLRSYKRDNQVYIKDILWNKGLPYCYSPDLGIFIQFKTLHFKDNSQKLIKNYKSIPSTTQKPEPYSSISVLPFYMLSFFSAETQKYLKQFLQDYKPKVIVDLGSWMGASAAFMAFLMQEEGRLYAVDYFNTSLDSYLIDKKEEIDNNSDIPRLYRQFLSNIIHYKLCDKIIPLKMSTLEAAKLFEIKADLIFVDAATDEESVYKDIMNWYPKLSKNGIICGDNWNWFMSVQRGVSRAAKELGKTVVTDNNFWYFAIEQ